MRDSQCRTPHQHRAKQLCRAPWSSRHVAALDPACAHGSSLANFAMLTCDGADEDGQERPGLQRDLGRDGHQEAHCQAQANGRQHWQGLGALDMGMYGEMDDSTDAAGGLDGGRRCKTPAVAISLHSRSGGTDPTRLQLWWVLLSCTDNRPTPHRALLSTCQAGGSAGTATEPLAEAEAEATRGFS